MMSWLPRRALPFAAAIVLGAVAAVWALRRPRADAPIAAATVSVAADPQYASAVQPIFDRRCVPCHACFDSPCQLNMQSFEGVDRGANKAIVYYAERPVQVTPTRMFQDAQSTATWQSQFGFFPVIDRVDRANPHDLDRSILWRFVEQRAADRRGGFFDVDNAAACPSTAADAERDLRDHPERGMPFGLPPLDSNERDVLAAWLRRGSGAPPSRDLDEGPVAQRAIATWEGFFNGNDPRAALVSTYLFEHFFYGHLYFPDVPGEWFRLVRSRTPSGSPIDEIATRRPCDDPGTSTVYYRLRRIHETLVLKTHAPYALSDAKLGRLRELFYEAPWQGAGPWKVDRSTKNPFVRFSAIPARSRYQFLLDDAYHFVQTFIHGPVCRGQAALDVIEEQFLIFFLAPESDPAIVDPGYLAQIAPDLELPAEEGESIAALSPGFDAEELTYLAAEVPHVRKRGFADVWHGDGTNPSAVLTVFRHYDNAFVLHGAVGGMPKTAWVLDYPTFERMYYDLVAGFDVYGNVTHQLGTRIYMNYLRIEAEGQFLRLLPKGERSRLFGEWYRGRIARALAGVHAAAVRGPAPSIAFSDAARAKEELVTRLLTKELPAAVAGPREPIQWPDVPFAADAVRAHAERTLRLIAGKTGASVAPFPDTVLLRVKSSNGDLVYTIARNRSHASVEYILAEGVELEPAEDTLQIVGGIASSRPNLFLVVDERDLEAFVSDWQALGTGDRSWGAFVDRWGVRRSHPQFWDAFDFFTSECLRIDPIGGAVLDLSRYMND
ncbi:MAG TPA: fatty acid cis/trans isomerase [Polyangiaceae bacterium]|jgi:hypothetical protein|nr:fatty acid cis/trans isomerase [Polyangiaceae bacterium]